MRRKLILFVALGAAVSGLGLAAMVASRFDSEKLGQALLERLGERTGLAIEAEEFDLGLFRGLNLQGIHISGRLPSGEIEATADRLIFEHRLRPLLSGTLAVDRVILSRPRIVLHEGPPPGGTSVSGSTAPPASSGGGEHRQETETDPAEETIGKASLSVEISSLEIEDAALSIHPGGGAPAATEIEGLNLELRNLVSATGGVEPLLAMKAKGALKVDRVRLGETMGRDGEGDFEILDGHLRVARFGFISDLGRFMVGELDLDLTRDPLGYSLSFEGAPLETEKLVGLAGGGELGAGRLRLEATGIGSEPSGLTGSGIFALDGGTLPEIPLLVAVERLVGKSAFLGSEYEGLEVEFRIADNRIELVPFDLEAGEASLGLSGWVGLVEGLSLEASVLLPREGIQIEEIPEELLDALTDADGLVNLPLEITGTTEAPRVRANTRALKALGRSKARERVEDEVGRRLGKLLGRSRQ